MHHILRDRKTGVFDHAVGLGDAGKTTERQHSQHEKRMERTTARDPAGDFQNAVIGFQKCVRQTGEGNEENVQQIEKHHITAQLRDADQSGDDGVISGIKKPFRLCFLFRQCNGR